MKGDLRQTYSRFDVMNDRDIYKQLPNKGNHMCFGCSPENPIGLHMAFCTDEKSLYSWLKVSAHLCGWNHIVHGGIVSTILDEIMARSVIYFLRRYGVTKSITVDFLKPIFTEKELKVEGTVIEKINQEEILMKGLLYNEKGDLCAKSVGLFTLFTSESIRTFGAEYR